MILTDQEADEQLKQFLRPFGGFLQTIMTSITDDPDTPVDESSISSLEWLNLTSQAASTGTQFLSTVMINKTSAKDIAMLLEAFARMGINV